MDYTLQLMIDPEDLAILKAAQENIIIAKPVGGGNPTVTWLSIDPFEENTVTWTEVYGLYASTSGIQAGAKINKVSQVKTAEDGNNYPFESTNLFGPPAPLPPVPNGTFVINNVNDNPLYPSLTFGLTQSATVNTGVRKENAPISAAAVPAGQNVSLTPLTSVWVWLEANLLDGTVITQVTSKRAIVTFGDGVTRIDLKYSRSKGHFVETTLSGELTTSRNFLLYDPQAPVMRARDDGFRELVSAP